MKLIGELIYLRGANESDIDVIHRWENDTTNWLVSNTVVPYSKEQIMQFLQEENDIYQASQVRLMMINSDEQSVGCIDLYEFDPKNRRVGIGILVDIGHRGKGYAREALNLAMEYCYASLEVHMLFADVLVTNESSMHLFESVGFKQTGIREDWLWDGETFIDQIFYQRFKG